MRMNMMELACAVLALRDVLARPGHDVYATIDGDRHKARIWHERPGLFGLWRKRRLLDTVTLI